jgi:hypothetical protein
LVEAGLDRASLLVPTGEGNELRRGSPRPLANSTRESVTIEVGEADVEHDDVGVNFCADAQRLGRVVGYVHLVSLELKHRAEPVHDVSIVVDEENPRGTRNASPDRLR